MKNIFFILFLFSPSFLLAGDFMTQGRLEECVGYFTSGGPTQWIGGGITLAFTIFFVITKHSLPSIVRSFGKFLMETKNLNDEKSTEENNK